MAAPTRPGEFFTYREFQLASTIRLSAADRRGLRILCSVYLDPMRRRFGRCQVHSAGRSVKHNAQVGGASRSYHVYRLRPGDAAADVSFATGTPREWAEMARSLGPTWSEEYVGHVHVDTRDLI